MSRVVFQGFLVSLFIGVGVFAPVGWVLSPYLLQLVHAAPDVQAVALPYLRLMFVFSIGMMFFYLIGGALRAAGDAKTPMRLGIFLTISNIVAGHRLHHRLSARCRRWASPAPPSAPPWPAS